LLRPQPLGDVRRLFGEFSGNRRFVSIALSHKAAKLLKLCALEGYKRLDDLLKASASDSVSSHLYDGRLRLHD
jgi:hypothetical protein